jgi:hypothetical protein
LVTVRKATAHLRNKNNESEDQEIGSSKTSVQKEFVKVLNSKASNDSFMSLAESKANKMDLELQMKSVDIMHK